MPGSQRPRPPVPASRPPASPLRIATRASPLARWQASHVADLLAAMGVSAELVLLTTRGDSESQLPISVIGGTGVFATEVRRAVLEGRADLAVHSAKDLPSEATSGLVIAAVPPRADPRDALVGAPLHELGPGAVVATGAPRRRAQLAWLRPDLAFVELRGNIETRLARVPPGGAVVVAAAALDRLGLAHRAVEILDPALMLPQVGQGALAVECRTENTQLISLLAGIDDAGAHRGVDAERAFLCEIGPGCSLPVAAHSPPSAAENLRLDALLASLDGRSLVRRSGTGTDPAELGARLVAEIKGTPEGAALMKSYPR